MVVVRSPALDDGACFRQAAEPMQVQAVLPELAVEALYERILSRLSGLDEVQPHAGSPSPEEQGLGSELRAIVEH